MIFIFLFSSTGEWAQRVNRITMRLCLRPVTVLFGCVCVCVVCVVCVSLFFSVYACGCMYGCVCEKRRSRNLSIWSYALRYNVVCKWFFFSTSSSDLCEHVCRFMFVSNTRGNHTTLTHTHCTHTNTPSMCAAFNQWARQTRACVRTRYSMNVQMPSLVSACGVHTDRVVLLWRMARMLTVCIQYETTARVCNVCMRVCCGVCYGHFSCIQCVHTTTATRARQRVLRFYDICRSCLESRLPSRIWSGNATWHFVSSLFSFLFLFFFFLSKSGHRTIFKENKKHVRTCFPMIEQINNKCL